MRNTCVKLESSAVDFINTCLGILTLPPEAQTLTVHVINVQLFAEMVSP